ncbi:MAG: replication protein [Bdellovibrionia bacterium]
MANLDEMMQKAKQKGFRRPDEIVRANILAANEEEKNKQNQLVKSQIVGDSTTMAKKDIVSKKPTVDTLDTVYKKETVVNLTTVDKSTTMAKSTTVVKKETVAKIPIVSVSPNDKPSPAQLMTEKGGYMLITNRIVETLYKENLGERKLRVLLFLIRRTIGWREQSVFLSANDLKSELGYDNSTIWKILTPLIQDEYILSTSTGGGRTNCYSLNPKKFGKILVAETVVKTPTVDKKDTVYDLTVSNLDTVVKTPTITVVNSPTVNSGQNTHSTPYNNTGLNTELKTPSLSLSEIEKYFDEIYFSKIRAPKMEREERNSFRDIIQRNKDLTLEELKECFSLVEADHDSKGNPIKSKFLWMAKGLDQILMEAKDNLSWKSKPPIEETLSPIESQSPTEKRNPDFTPEEKQAREALLPELLTKRSNLIASEKAFLETSDDTDLTYRMTNCRNDFEEFLVTNEALLAREVIKYTTTEPFRIKEWIAAIEKYTFTGSENTANKQASIFKIILEQLGNWHEEAKKRNHPIFKKLKTDKKEGHDEKENRF